jgi:hypothetical protein
MRVLNRVAGLVLALALLAGGLLAAVEAVLVGLDRPPVLVDRQGWYQTLTSTRFADRGFLAVAAGVALLGLLVLALQLHRWRPTRLPVPDAEGWYVQRRSAERLLAGAAASQPGVDTATVRLHARHGTWRPSVSAVGDPAAEDRVAAAVRAELVRLAGSSDGIEVNLVRKRRVS